jgi:hypothetical protein
MDDEWREAFRNRMRHFEARHAAMPGEVAVSIKVRIRSGCFHRECSPRAYELIDRRLNKFKFDAQFGFEEHESGPEILVYLAITTAGLSLAKSVVDLIATIIKARSEGIKKGDRPSDPVELIVRRVHNPQGVREETVLRVGPHDAFDEGKIEQQLKDALRKLLEGERSDEDLS